jgi:hypothetical protein
VLDGDFAVVGDRGPDGDGLSGHVASSVESDSAGDRAGSHARQTDLVLDLAVERLLENKRIYFSLNTISNLILKII